MEEGEGGEEGPREASWGPGAALGVRVEGGEPGWGLQGSAGAFPQQHLGLLGIFLGVSKAHFMGDALKPSLPVCARGAVGLCLLPQFW